MCVCARVCVHAVLVDEASMLDVSVAAALMRALHDDTHLILIGDPNQLPPVGSGAVLKDMLASALFPRVSACAHFAQTIPVLADIVLAASTCTPVRAALMGR